MAVFIFDQKCKMFLHVKPPGKPRSCLKRSAILIAVMNNVSGSSTNCNGKAVVWVLSNASLFSYGHIVTLNLQHRHEFLKRCPGSVTETPQDTRGS